MKKCPNCGNGSGNYVIKNCNGYKECRCEYCGTILNRIIDIKEFDVEHAPFSTEIDSDKILVIS